MDKKIPFRTLIVIFFILFLLPISAQAGETEEAQMQNIVQQLMSEVLFLTWPPHDNEPCLALALSDLHNRLDEMAGVQAFWGHITSGAVDAINPPRTIREVLKEAMKAAASEAYERLRERNDESAVQVSEYKPGTVNNFFRWLTGDCDVSLKVVWPEGSTSFTVLFAGDCDCEYSGLDDFYIQFQGTLSENEDDPSSPTHYDIVNLEEDFWNPDVADQTRYSVNCCEKEDVDRGIDAGDEVGQAPPKQTDRAIYVPDQFAMILGDGQTINVKVSTEEKGDLNYFLALNKAEGNKYYISMLSNIDAKPTMTVNTNEYVLWKLQNTDDKLGFAQEMIASGAIDVKATKKKLAYSYEIGTVINKYNLIKKMDRFDVKTGTKKEIEYNGIKAELTLNVKNERIVNTGISNNLIVVNNVGRTEAYTTPRVQQIIATAPTKFSEGAGKYTISLANAKQNIAQQTKLPAIEIKRSTVPIQTPKQQAQQFVASKKPSNQLSFTLPKTGSAVISTPSEAMSAGAKYAYVASSYSNKPSYLIR